MDKLLSPLPHDLVGAARCLGANYGAKKTPVWVQPLLYARQSDVACSPILFLKPQASLSHPNSPIKVPRLREPEVRLLGSSLAQG